MMSERPSVYRYWDQLLEHIGSKDVIFNGKVTWPRQLELHLPADHKHACNFKCFYCAGHKFVKDLGRFELDALELLRRIGGRIPYVIYGGSFTEPIMNPYFLAFLAMTKKTGAHFGIHTNGSLLMRLEEDQGWLTELGMLATDEIDYLSVSLDAGDSESHCKTKMVEHDWFREILEGIRMAVNAKRDGPAVRLCYLMNDYNSGQDEIDRIVNFARKSGVDSLRFSIPFAHYAQSFEVVRQYRDKVERASKDPYFKRVQRHLSKDQSDRPFIFWMDPAFQDIDLYDFKKCAYGYYQICLGADGYVYRCTTMSSPTFKKLRLGKVTSSLEDFEAMIGRNQDPEFRAKRCFDVGARCNRMAISVNREWAGLKMPE